MNDPLATNANNPEIPLQEKVQGKNLFYAPQPPLTTANGSALSSGGAYNLTTADNAILGNTITRLNQVEAALIKLGLLRHP